ncbi:calcium-dependent phosphotriesterase [Basidiobolus meristosporus CBS 931.73]|uniref:Calcium-dependent phosphotriesterase n=1 Tax=Basidiobolus meristosporus CBS 931.73 TaxID=1314790 RepID=A0A1Y1YKH3_9FUNG|nr:calcium-dependent phosphotriesterase [Basidiobolus meristosporus CBS 931.73]|eukprot:ORX98094.1 calcium-dependent phosphotriesterase [Basidiobolus meristosporus CBS 931.73]
MREFSQLGWLFIIATNVTNAQLQSNSRVVEVDRKCNVLPEPFSREIGEPFYKTQAFYNIIGRQPKLSVVAERNYSFAHEAGIYIPKTKEIMFTSNRLGNLSGTDQYTEIYKMNVRTYKVTKVTPSIDIPLANGGTFYKGKAIVVSQGRGDIGAAIYSIDPVTYETSVLLNNYFGLKFNSLNDIAVSHLDGSFWFTDPSYAYEQEFRSRPQLGEFVYRWDPNTGDVRLAADGFVKPNGIQFSPNEKIAYISDTGFTTGRGEIDVKRPHTIYAFDVLRGTDGLVSLTNRRVFAMSDVGIPDGIKLDVKGNVYVGSGDGVNVYSPQGYLLGKINTIQCANLVFVQDDLYILAENKIFHTKLSIQGVAFD